MSGAPVVVVGAGVAGLVCTADLVAAGIDTVLVEASDGPGGRVRTDVVDGYRLDRGFQILLTAYPQVQARLDLERLALGRFEPGAVIRRHGGFHHVADPLRSPRHLVGTVRAPIGGLADKVRLARLVLDVRRGRVPDLLRRPDGTTAERLASAGFSAAMVDALWRPLFAGIQLDPGLEVSRRRFDVILRMLAVGGTGVPSLGIGAVADQLAEPIPTDAVRYGAAASEVGAGRVVLESGERLAARAVVVATEGPAAHRLLGDRVPDPGSRAVACCWFAAPGAPRPGPVLMLDGDGAAGGPAANVAVMSEVAPSYAPAGRALVAAAVPGPEALSVGLADRVRAQLARWFDSGVADWELLRTDVIPHGQPRQAPPLAPKRRVDLGGGLFVCGDHRDTASLQGAMFSGERTAAAVRAALASGAI